MTYSHTLRIVQRMEQTQTTSTTYTETPVVMVSPEGASESLPEVLAAYNLKRSAKKVLTEAIDAGWSLELIEVNHTMTFKFIRTDAEQQQEAIDAVGYQTRRTAPLVSATASFDKDSGAYWCGSAYNDSGVTAFPRPDSLTEFIAQLQGPARLFAAAAAKAANEDKAEQRRTSAADLFNEYVQSEEYEATRYERKKLEELAAFKPQPIDINTSSPERIIRDAKEAVVYVLAAQLAAQALAREGAPKMWHEDIACAPTTLQEAVDAVVLKAVTDSWTSSDLDTELRKACEKVRRGF